jgi:exopolysaccharide biosynthesis protein
MKHISVLILALLFVLHATAAAIARPPPLLVTVPVANDNSDATTNVTLVDKMNGNHKAYIVNMSVSQDVFTVQRPTRLEKVSEQSQFHQCHIAANGGPFQSNGDSVGGVVVNGQVVSNDFQESNVGFGRTYKNEWILGGIRNSTEATSLFVSDYVTGFDWLVYEGNVTVSSKHRYLRTHDRAPRTAIGVDRLGHLLLLVVDGCEACFRHQGLTLKELARLFQSLGVHHAINLDGGGSTTLVQHSIVLNVPTCHDVPWKCERPVSTIVCLKHKSYHDEESDSENATQDNEEEDAE